MDWKLEVVVVPVADVDRSYEFYVDKLGFTLDTDHRAGDAFRVVQVTPPGSACSIIFGKGMGDGVPGSVRAASSWSRTSRPRTSTWRRQGSRLRSVILARAA